MKDAAGGVVGDLGLQTIMSGTKFAAMALGGVVDKNAGGSSKAGIQLGKEFGDNAKPVIQKIGGLASNERLEQVFKSVNFRDFTFDYEFAPRTPDESTTIKTIIDKFKYHMMPELTTSHNMYYIMPDEFDIELRFASGNSSTENPFIHKIMTCVLVSCVVNYNPTGTFNTFKDGAPPVIHLSLHFRELEPLVRSMVDPTVFGA